MGIGLERVKTCVPRYLWGVSTSLSLSSKNKQGRGDAFTKQPAYATHFADAGLSNPPDNPAAEILYKAVVTRLREIT